MEREALHIMLLGDTAGYSLFDWLIKNIIRHWPYLLNVIIGPQGRLSLFNNTSTKKFLDQKFFLPKFFFTKNFFD